MSSSQPARRRLAAGVLGLFSILTACGPPTLPAATQETSIPVGAAPSQVTIAGGWVWVTHRQGRRIEQIDPATNEVVSTMNVPKGSGDASLLDPASGGGRLWVGDRRTRRIYVLDASSGKRLGSFETDGRPDRVFYASGFVWFSTENSDSGSTLSKVNPSSFEVKGRTRIPHNAFPVSIDRVRRRTWMVLTRAFHLAGARHATWRVESRLWELGKGAQPFVVSDQSLGSTIQRGAVDPLVSDVEKWGDKLVLGRLPEFRMTWIRPASRKLGKSVFTKRFELPWEIEKVGSKLWVGNLNDEMLLEIDPATNERQIVTVGSETGSLTGGLGSLWVPLGGDDYWDDPGEVVRIDS